MQKLTPEAPGLDRNEQAAADYEALLRRNESRRKPLSPRSLANRKSTLARRLGADHPSVIAAGRDLEAAFVLLALARARRKGLDNTDLMALVKTGRLPAEVAA